MFNFALFKEKWRAHNRAKTVPADVVRPGPGQESVWNYPAVPMVETVGEAIRVFLAQRSLTASTQALRIIEMGLPPSYYIPPEDVRMDWLVASKTETWCEWKGRAQYYTIGFGSLELHDVAWSYPEPEREYRDIAGYIAFYPQAVAAYIGRSRVQSQASVYYGGWMTERLVGPFKNRPTSAEGTDKNP